MENNSVVARLAAEGNKTPAIPRKHSTPSTSGSIVDRLAAEGAAAHPKKTTVKTKIHKSRSVLQSVWLIVAPWLRLIILMLFGYFVGWVFGFAPHAILKLIYIGNDNQMLFANTAQTLCAWIGLVIGGFYALYFNSQASRQAAAKK